MFSWSFGCELEALVGQPYRADTKRSEAERYVREALLVNPYIKGVTQIGVDFQDSALSLRFKLTTIYGEVRIDGCDIAL